MEDDETETGSALSVASTQRLFGASQPSSLASHEERDFLLSRPPDEKASPYAAGPLIIGVLVGGMLVRPRSEELMPLPLRLTYAHTVFFFFSFSFCFLSLGASFCSFLFLSFSFFFSFFFLLLSPPQSFSNCYFGLQTGWVTMGSLQSALVGFGLCRLLRIKPFGPTENVMLQTIAVATATMPLAGGWRKNQKKIKNNVKIK